MNIWLLTAFVVFYLLGFYSGYKKVNAMKNKPRYRLYFNRSLWAYYAYPIIDGKEDRTSTPIYCI